MKQAPGIQVTFKPLKVKAVTKIAGPSQLAGKTASFVLINLAEGL
jgi:hypothetical protein